MGLRDDYASIEPCEDPTIHWDEWTPYSMAKKLVETFFSDTLIKTEDCLYAFNGIYWEPFENGDLYTEY
jgi:hypothetical protein